MFFFFLFNLILGAMNIYVSFTTVVPKKFYGLIYNVGCDFPNDFNKDDPCCNIESADHKICATIGNFLFPLAFRAINISLVLMCLYWMLFILLPVIKNNLRCGKRKREHSVFEDNLLSQSDSTSNAIIITNLENEYIY